MTSRKRCNNLLHESMTIPRGTASGFIPILRSPVTSPQWSKSGAISQGIRTETRSWEGAGGLKTCAARCGDLTDG